MPISRLYSLPRKTRVLGPQQSSVKILRDFSLSPSRDPLSSVCDQVHMVLCLSFSLLMTLRIENFAM